MRAVARAERQFVAKHPDIPPFFFNMFHHFDAQPRLYGGGDPDVRFRQVLAKPFLESWHAAGAGGL